MYGRGDFSCSEEEGRVYVLMSTFKRGIQVRWTVEEALRRISDAGKSTLVSAGWKLTSAYFIRERLALVPVCNRLGAA